MVNNNLLSKNTRALFLVFFIFSQFSIAQVKHYETNYFREIHAMQFFKTDNKAFVDMIPLKLPIALDKQFLKLEPKDNITVGNWLRENFVVPQVNSGHIFVVDSNKPIDEHLRQMWKTELLKIDIGKVNTSRNTLIQLPYKYIVPGGRFKEVYYWDSYFTMLGLAVDEEWSTIGSMIQNFAYLIDTFGFIPNGNRQYYLTRSQPPYYSLMIELFEKKYRDIDIKYLPQMLKEYKFFMNGSENLRIGETFEHVVKLNDSVVLNRYYDKGNSPRPENYQNDKEFEDTLFSQDDKERLMSNFRAACESGWDFSSRWFEDRKSLKTIRTLEIIPIDLNCLMFEMERIISKAFFKIYKFDSSEMFLKKANDRKRNILKYFWNDSLKTFVDYDLVYNKPMNFSTSLCVFPLFSKIATDSQARYVFKDLENNYLKKGGWVTSTTITGEQWDAPNARAPIQWLVFKGLENYGYRKLAYEGASRFVHLVEMVFKKEQKMMDKYDVIDITKKGGGGDYPTQDGFGWTNGVYIALKNAMKAKR